jgi:hypothetical protein
MMTRPAYAASLAVAFLALATARSPAETILKIDLGDDPLADLSMSSATFGTVDDGDGSTLGDQNTSINFLQTLPNPLNDVVGPEQGSLSVTGVMLHGMPSVLSGSFVVQPTMGGSFSLWNENNQLLLSGTLNAGTITGTIGGSATGAFATLDMGNFTGGSLLDGLESDSAAISLSFANVGGGLGLSTDMSGHLNDFTADAAGNVAAQIPEPGGALLAATGCLAAGLACHPARRSRGHRLRR